MKNMTIKLRLGFVIGFLSLLLVAIGFVGLYGTADSNRGMNSIYQDRLLPAMQLSEIEQLMRDIVIELQHAFRFDPQLITSMLVEHPITDHTDQVVEYTQQVDTIWAEYMTTVLTAEEAQLAQQFSTLYDRVVEQGLQPIINMFVIDAFMAADQHLDLVLRPALDELSMVLDQLQALQGTVAQQEYQAAAARYENLLMIVIAVVGSGVLLAIVIGWLLIRAIVGPLQRTSHYFNRIAEGELDNEIVITQNDEIGKVMVGLRDMQTKLKADINATQRLSSENLRIRYALDSVSSSVMVTDPEANIIYANDAVINAFHKGLPALRQALPGFDPDQIRGGSFNMFNLDRLRHSFDTLTAPHDSEQALGGRTYKLIASPIHDEDGSRLGTVIEWADRTEELKVEHEVTALVEGAVQGDLSRRVATDDLDGFFLRLGEGINGMVEQLQQLIGQITESVDAINTGAREIAVGNSDLSQRTEEQASSLEETASSMEQLTSTVKQNADNSKQANQLSSNAQHVATQGGEKIQHAIHAMQAITASSEKISDIITVIDGIAFQTNILALNAAVEAARAGEQGRGFAVVAAEVRNLAQRSAAAAKEIKGLIAENSTTISSGSHLVEEAGQTMSDIVTQSKRVSDLIAEIAAASDEQRSGIEEVNVAITQMDEVTQQNASLVEQAAAASESLEEQAQALSQAVSIFQAHTHPTATAVSQSPTPTRPPSRAMHKPTPQSASGDEWEEF
jgi:methyl-accepting chemotaxis protein